MLLSQRTEVISLFSVELSERSIRGGQRTGLLSGRNWTALARDPTSGPAVALVHC